MSSTDEGGLLAFLREQLCSKLHLASHEIIDEKPLNAHGADSVFVSELLYELEEQFGIHASDEQLWKAPSLRALAGTLVALLGSRR
ncbi:MAG TPA: acyl carrier protein [Archangium sp.]